MGIKEDIIRIRVTKEQKELFKSIAKGKKVSMSEYMLVATEEKVIKEQEKLANKDKVEQRALTLESKLQEIKLKMESKRDEKKNIKKFSDEVYKLNLKFFKYMGKCSKF